MSTTCIGWRISSAAPRSLRRHSSRHVGSGPHGANENDDDHSDDRQCLTFNTAAAPRVDDDAAERGAVARAMLTPSE